MLLIVNTASYSCVCVWYTQSFQWRVSRVVEPQLTQPKEKVYSIASALPRPYYSSPLSQLTNVSMRNEERVAFSQTEHSPLNTAQQLTLLQQVPREQEVLFFFTHLALDFLCCSWLCSLSNFKSSFREPFNFTQTSGIRKLEFFPPISHECSTKGSGRK